MNRVESTQLKEIGKKLQYFEPIWLKVYQIEVN